MKMTRKIVAVLMVFIMMASIAPMQAQAAKKKISNGNAKAYAKMINRLSKKSARRDMPPVIIVHDMNHDGVPELLYSNWPYGSCPNGYDVYTYRKGKIVKLGPCPNGICKVRGSKTKYKYSTFTGVGCQEFGQITFSKNKIKRKVYGKYAGMPTKYYVKGKRVSKKKWEKEEKKYMKNTKWLNSTDIKGEKWTASKVKSVVK